MNSYQKQKAAVREKAIDWQADFCMDSYSWEELADWYDYFEKLAKRYGLIKEFKENGII